MTLPRGKLECRSSNAKTSSNQIPLWTLVQCCPEGRVAVSGVGAGKLVRITGFEITRLEGSNTACLKGSIINLKEIAAELKPL